MGSARRLIVAVTIMAAATHTLAAQQNVRITAGMVITHSVHITPGTYRIAAPASPDSAVITIRGDDITVDFSGAVLEGSAVTDDPDKAAGVAIRIDGGRNIEVRNARVRGYKVGLLARGIAGSLPATISATTGSRSSSASWNMRASSTGSHTKERRR